MKLTPEEIRAIREERGLHVAEKCDECGKGLNQSVRYTTPGRPEVWCSAACQDKAMGWDKTATRKASGPAFYVRVCDVCTNKFRSRRKDARLCSARCRQILARRTKRAIGSDGVVTDNVQPPLAEAHG